MSALVTMLMGASLMAAPAVDLEPKQCDNCAEWNAPHEPIQLAPNTWYIGPRGLSVLMVRTPKGLVVFDGALPQSVPLIEANLKSLGHSLGDIKLILNSHAHYDHAGGLAALSRLSGAPVATRTLGAQALSRGNVDAADPQAAFGADNAYPPVSNVKELGDSETIQFGGLTITAHDSTGHTPGSTSYSWRDCGEGVCVDMVYADSVTAVSAPEFRFSDDPARLVVFEATFKRLAELPCQVLVSTHPDFSGLFEKAAKAGGTERFIDPDSCRNYAATGRERLALRLKEEASAQ
ncbi:MAG: subclass B3 metallo-beta-lactamase [Ahniella sp.]|nr:subclass B3 metallo-beta-lactamase [Ahniella sp.]